MIAIALWSHRPAAVSTRIIARGLCGSFKTAAATPPVTCADISAATFTPMPTRLIPSLAAQCTALAALICLSHAYHVMAAEDGHDDHDDHAGEIVQATDTRAVWGYSFLFTIIAQLPSALAIIVCLWTKVSIANAVITNLMALASGVKPRTVILSHPAARPC